VKLDDNDDDDDDDDEIDGSSPQKFIIAAS